MDNPLSTVRMLFGGHCCHIDRHIFAAKATSMESDAAFDQCEEGMVFAHADAFARVHFRAALTNDNVSADHFLTAELFHAKPTTF